MESNGRVVKEYSTLREGAGLVQASTWTVLRLTGPDTQGFLDGLATQDLSDARSGVASETMFLNEKGRPVALAWASIDPDGSSAWVLADEGARDSLAAHMTRFRIMEEVEIEGPTGMPELCLVIGPERNNYLRELAGPGSIALESDALSFLLLPAFAAAAASAGPPAVTPSAFEAWRIAAGIPRTGVDFDLDRIATEVNRPEAISQTKGCYVGQEVVARTAGRGHVRRLRTGFRFPWPGSPLTPRAEIQSEGRAVGFVTSSTLEPGSGEGLAMGYLSTDLTASADLTVGGPESPISIRIATSTV